MEMITGKKSRIVILGSFPMWLLETDLPRPEGHYAVWLVALYHALQNVSEYEIHWICFCRGLLRTRCVQHGNQVFHALPGGPLSLASRTRYLWDRWRVKRLLKQLKPDIVHAWGTENRYAVCAADAPCRKILSMQGILTTYQRMCPMGSFMCRQARMESRLLPLFDLVTSESEWGCSACREIAPHSKVVRWEYAAEERFFHVSRQLTPIPTCLMAGSDTPIKNVETAISAFADKSLAHVTLLLAGVAHESRPHLPPNIIPLGRVNRERMSELLSSAWALVHPTLADTSPNIVKEARVVGMPVVTTTECGGAQYVDEGKSGYIVEPRDVVGLREAVLRMTCDAETSLRMGAWQQEECRRLLGVDTMVARLREIYEAVSENREGELR